MPHEGRTAEPETKGKDNVKIDQTGHANSMKVSAVGF